MTELTAGQESLISWMRRGPDYAWKGFEELLKPGRSFEKAFSALFDAGLFESNQNPAPVEVKPGSFQVPYWKALDYLVALAKIAGERNDNELSGRILQIVRDVTQNCANGNEDRGNYHTFREFAKIISLVPTGALTIPDMEMMPVWLRARFDNGGVTHETGDRVLPKLLASPSPEDTAKACRILFHVTAIQWVEEKGWGDGRKKPASVADDYWLKKLVTDNGPAFASKAPKASSEVLAIRVREVFGAPGRENLSQVWRPAIEDHGQNHSFYGLENLLIEGLRDIVGLWIKTNADEAVHSVEVMLTDEVDVVRRIGIHLLNEHWDILSKLYPLALESGLLEVGELHESYRLLQAHFVDLDDTSKMATLAAIRQIKPYAEGDEAQQNLRSFQRRWLSAIRGKGFDPADRWSAEMDSDPALGGLPEHPDFVGYMESRWGFGPSPFPANELIGLAEAGTLVETLNSFQETGSWKGPTTKGLVQSLEEAVAMEPSKFVQLLSDFQGAKRPFQYALISGFLKLWKAPKAESVQVDWDRTWLSLFKFFEILLDSSGIWTEDDSNADAMTPTAKWIPPSIVEIMSEGSRSEDRYFPEVLLPRALPIIKRVLDNAEPAEEPAKDPMFRTINSLRGKAIESLIILALRECRILRRQTGRHEVAWERFRPIFDEQLSMCRDTNFEFSTLAADYILHLEFLDADWLRRHIKGIFPAEFPRNSICAFHGLSYARESRSVYTLLVENGIIDQGLRLELGGEQARERLLQRLAIAYMWGQEELNSPRFSYLFEMSKPDDLVAIVEFFAECQSDSEEHAKRILGFWGRCLSWASNLPDPPGELLAVLSRLTWYLKTIGPDEKMWLLAVAPFVSLNHNTHRFIQNLDSLADQNPIAVCEVLKKVFETSFPYYDYEDRIEALLEKLWKSGLRMEVTFLIERLRSSLPSITQLYNRLNQ